MKELLLKLKACGLAIDWAGDKTIEEIWATCHRGDWMLWLARKLDIDKRVVTLAKGHCANTVRHLMKDERSIDAVDMAIKYGEGNATDTELAAAYAAAYAATDADAAAKINLATKLLNKVKDIKKDKTYTEKLIDSLINFVNTTKED